MHQEPTKGPASGRVLLVDDEPLMRRATGRLLEALGYEVRSAEDGTEAEAMLTQWPELRGHLHARHDGLGKLTDPASTVGKAVVTSSRSRKGDLELTIDFVQTGSPQG